MLSGPVVNGKSGTQTNAAGGWLWTDPGWSSLEKGSCHIYRPISTIKYGSPPCLGLHYFIVTNIWCDMICHLADVMQAKHNTQTSLIRFYYNPLLKVKLGYPQLTWTRRETAPVSTRSCLFHCKQLALFHCVHLTWTSPGMSVSEPRRWRRRGDIRRLSREAWSLPSSDFCSKLTVSSAIGRKMLFIIQQSLQTTASAHEHPIEWPLSLFFDHTAIYIRMKQETTVTICLAHHQVAELFSSKLLLLKCKNQMHQGYYSILAIPCCLPQANKAHLLTSTGWTADQQAVVTFTPECMLGMDSPQQKLQLPKSGGRTASSRKMQRCKNLRATSA